MLRPSTEIHIPRKPILSVRNDSMYEVDSTPKVLTVMLIDDDPSISFLFTEYLNQRE